MRWPIFAILAYVFLVLQIGLRTLFQIDVLGASPSWLLILGVFVAIWAPSMDALWAMLVLGLLEDLTRHVVGAGPAATFTLAGPLALGYLVAGFAVLQMRGLIFRESALAVATMVFLGGMLAQLVMIALLLTRGLFVQPASEWHAADELVRGFGTVLYSAVLTLPLNPILRRADARMNLHPIKGLAHSRAHRAA